MAEKDSNTGRFFEEFKPVSTEEWEEAIRKDLKGADYEKKLVWQSPEGFKVMPYYREEHLEGIPFIHSLPGIFPFVRGNKKTDNTWKIRQDIAIDKDNFENSLQKAKTIIQKGVNSIGFRVAEEFSIEYSDFEKLMTQIWQNGIEINIEAGLQTPQIAEFLSKYAQNDKLPFEKLEGCLSFDPLIHVLLNGNYPVGEDEISLFDKARQIIETTKDFPKVKSLTISGYLFGNSGSSIVQELAFSLSAAVEYFHRLTDLGLSVSDISNKMRFIFSIGSNYFFEIAKLRAARMLWARVVNEFRPSDMDSCKMNIHCVTSAYNKTLYDPYVNMLRTTTEAMAATLGGTDSLEVLPFDFPSGKTTEFSERIARNQQLILKEEAGFDKIADPSAGAYYIENLTDNIAREAWKLFLEIENQGGYYQALRVGKIQEMISGNALKREAAIASRKETLVGTNQYPDLNEYIDKELDPSIYTKPQIPTAAYTIQPLIPYRGSMPMEELRYKTDFYSKNHKRPAVFLLLIGNVAMRQARAQFSSNFFGCAGFQIIAGNPVASVDEGIRAAHESKAEIVVICSSDEEYIQYAPAIYQELKDETLVVVAGNPPSAEELKSMGLTHFIHLRSQLLDTLRQYQKDLHIVS